MKISKLKLIFGSIAVIVCFFIATYFKNWGTAVAEKNTDDLTPIVKQLKDHPKSAKKLCPKVVSRLESGIPELRKNGMTEKIATSYKLIADCQMAAEQYTLAAKSYEKISELQPQIARWYHRQAEALLMAEQPGEALPKSHLATQLEPEKFIYIRLKARILAELHLNNRAIDAYHQAVKLAPFEELDTTKNELKEFLSKSEPS